MDSDFRLQITKSIVSREQNRGAFDARLLTVLHIQNFRFITIAISPAQVHPQKHFRPVLRFRTPRPGINGHESIIKIAFP